MLICLFLLKFKKIKFTFWYIKNEYFISYFNGNWTYKLDNMSNAQINQKTKQATFELDGTQYEVDIGEVGLKSSPSGGAPDVKQIQKMLYRTLALDNLYRKPGVKRPLHSLSDLKEGMWKDDISPYFMVAGSKCKKEVALTVEDNEQFSYLFYLKYPMLMGIDMTHVFVAGGCVSSLLIGHDNNGDVDLFIHGCNEEKAELVVGKILEMIKYWCDSSKETYEYKIYKGKFLIKFEIYQFAEGSDKPTLVQEIQIIFRLYQDKSEIINGFDVGSSSVGFDGKKVYFTEMAAYCYQNMVNVVDTERSSPTFANRLHKYVQRGFRILFPFIQASESWQGDHTHCCFRDLTIKKNAAGQWVTGKKPKVVWNAYNKALLTDAVIQANIRVPYTNKEMKRFIASYTGYCTDVWYTPKLREGLFVKIKQLYYHNVQPELMNKSLQKAISYLGPENVGDFVMVMHNVENSYEVKKTKCAEIREQMYVKMEKRVEEYHKTLQVQKGIVWKMTNPVEPISSSIGAKQDAQPEEWYDVCFDKKYELYYEGKKAQKYFDSELGCDQYDFKSYDEMGYPSHHNLFDAEAYAEYEKCLEEMASLVSTTSDVGGEEAGLETHAGPVATKSDEDNIKFV